MIHKIKHLNSKYKKPQVTVSWDLDRCISPSRGRQDCFPDLHGMVGRNWNWLNTYYVSSTVLSFPLPMIIRPRKKCYGPSISRRKQKAWRGFRSHSYESTMTLAPVSPSFIRKLHPGPHINCSNPEGWHCWATEHYVTWIPEGWVSFCVCFCFWGFFLHGLLSLQVSPVPNT